MEVARNKNGNILIHELPGMLWKIDLFKADHPKDMWVIQEKHTLYYYCNFGGGFRPIYDKIESNKIIIEALQFTINDIQKYLNELIIREIIE